MLQMTVRMYERLYKLHRNGIEAFCCLWACQSGIACMQRENKLYRHLAQYVGTPLKVNPICGPVVCISQNWPKLDVTSRPLPTDINFSRLIFFFFSRSFWRSERRNIVTEFNSSSAIVKAAGEREFSDVCFWGSSDRPRKPTAADHRGLFSFVGNAIEFDTQIELANEQTGFEQWETG